MWWTNIIYFLNIRKLKFFIYRKATKNHSKLHESLFIWAQKFTYLVVVHVFLAALHCPDYVLLHLVVDHILKYISMTAFSAKNNLIYGQVWAEVSWRIFQSYTCKISDLKKAANCIELSMLSVGSSLERVSSFTMLACIELLDKWTPLK